MGACGGKAEGMTADQKAAVETVQTMFGMWGQGKFATAQGEADFIKSMETINTPDATWDFTGPGPEIYKTYTGAKAFMPWMKYLEEFDFPNMNPSFFPGPPGSNIAIMYMNYDMTHKESKAAMTKQTDVFVFTVKGGKIASAKQYWGDVQGINKTLGPVHNYTGGTPDQAAAMKTVLTAFGMWGEGKFKASQSDEDYKKNLGSIWCADHVLDVRGPASPFHKEYKSGGDISGTKDWIKLLDAHEFTRMVPTFTPGPAGSNKVYCNMEYDIKYKGAEVKDMVDTMVFTVKDGKVYSLKQYWGDPVKVTEAFGELWEMPA
ncbi:unnamed protein product [Amoebophrya sp. A120]|nr:unnamed protein product [Amoebophrya sp. A120]|eukprot:GSA120T00022005001.1